MSVDAMQDGDIRRRALGHVFGRRQLGSALWHELQMLAGLLQGAEAVGLDSLTDMPDAQLGAIRPGVNPDYRISMNQGFVCAQLRGEDRVLQLFPTTRENLLVFNLFDRRHTIAEIAGQLSKALAWDMDESTAYTRALFLKLIRATVCIPVNLPDPVDDTSHRDAPSCSDEG